MKRSTRTTTWTGRVLAAGIVALTVAACGEAPPPPDAEEPAAAPPPAEDAAPPAIPVHPANDSGVSGEATAMHLHDVVAIVLEVEGLPQAGEYAAHIHQGICEEGGPVAAPLNPIVGLADGTGSGTTTLEVADLESDGPLFIQVHGAGGAPIACGDIEGHEF